MGVIIADYKDLSRAVVLLAVITADYEDLSRAVVFRVIADYEKLSRAVVFWTVISAVNFGYLKRAVVISIVILGKSMVGIT